MALKAQWTVQAGLLVGEPEPQYTRVWHLTSADWDGKSDEHRGARFAALADEAASYARALNDPGRVNWVLCSWFWV